MVYVARARKVEFEPSKPIFLKEIFDRFKGKEADPAEALTWPVDYEATLYLSGSLESKDCIGCGWWESLTIRIDAASDTYIMVYAYWDDEDNKELKAKILRRDP